MHCHKNISGRKSAPFEFSGEREFFPVRRKYPVHGQGKACFTLIELLVVIAIIAILAAMLLPALKSARDRGRSGNCLSNLKQLSSAFVTYATDNGDSTVLANPGKWHHGSPSNAYGNQRWAYLLFEHGYVPNPGMFYCPQAETIMVERSRRGGSVSSMANNKVGDGNAMTGSMYINYGYNYRWLGAGSGSEISGAYPYNKTTPKLGNLKSPSLKIAFSDALYLRSTNKEGAYWGWWGIYSTISGNTVTEGFDIMHDIHFKSANILFLDGHCGQQKDAVDTLQNGQSDVINRHWDPTKSK